MSQSIVRRTAVNALIEAYMDGRTFADAHAIRAFCLSLGLKRTKVTLGRVTAWDREARYALADDGRSVTSPSAAIKRERDPNASPEKRIQSRRAGILDVLTRLDNLNRLHSADAGQIDATAAEIRQATLLKALDMLAEQLVTETHIASTGAYQPSLIKS